MIEGGVEKHSEALYPRFPDDIELTVFRRKPYVNADSVYEHIHFIDLPSTKVKGFEAVFHSLLAACSAIREKPDVVHIHNIGPALFSGIVAKKGIPVVLTYHSPNYEHSKWGRVAKTILLYSEKVALKNASKIIFVNRFQMEKYPAEIQKKSVYIPNGIVRPTFTNKTDFLEGLGVEPQKYVLAVGRITPEKGLDTLIRAFISSNHDGYKLVIVGGVEFESLYMQELQNISTDDIIFTGSIFGEKLAQVYSNAALFVLASRNEGFPLVLLESMSYGLDVLASDIPGAHLVDLEEDDYFPVDDIKALAEKIENRIKKPRKRQYNLDGYDWDEVAARTAQVFYEVSR